MIIKALIPALLISLSTLVFAQPATEKKATEDNEKLQKEAIVFLRETLTDVNTMRSLENRISFTSELAGLMWFNDEREARSMYGGVIADFRDLLAKYDAQMNTFGVTAEDNEGNIGFLGIGSEPTDKSRLLRKFATAMGVRQQVALSIAEHDPELAFSFYYDSLAALSNPELRKQVESRDTYFESQLLSQIAENNAAKAAQFGAKAIEKGVSSNHIELLRKIYQKDPDKAAEFASAILSRLKNEKDSGSGRYYLLGSLLSFADKTVTASRKTPAKKPVYNATQMRDLAELLAQSLLLRSEGEAMLGTEYVETIQKYAPGRAAQIRAKYRRSTTGASSNSASNVSTMLLSSSGNNASPVNSNAAARYAEALRQREENEKAEQKLIDDVQSLGTKQLPKEERDKVIVQARKIIMMTPGRDKKIMALSMLAAQVTKLGDKELAGEIMRDAESFITPTPKTYQDYLLAWMLASGYAQTDPDKAFPLLEDIIERANGTLEAFVKIGEFMDVAEEAVQDGEVQVGAFGGQMVRGLTRDMGLADATIQVLARADFAKMKNVTNRFDRTEIRVLAKMMVLRAVLNPKQPPKPVVEDVVDPDTIEDSDGS